MKHEDDILETALNSGIRSAATKYDIDEKEVYRIVKEFKNDMKDLCSCDKQRLEGITVMCFQCDGYSDRIKL